LSRGGWLIDWCATHVPVSVPRIRSNRDWPPATARSSSSSTSSAT
jgi:hypothetical protein